MKNINWHNLQVSHTDRVNKNKHKPAVLWFTGLSGAGKSTIANTVDKLLYDMGCYTYILDGDNIRHGLNKDLGFDVASRIENIRRISEVANLFADAGVIVSTAFISPFIIDREQARYLIGSCFVEIFVDAGLDICQIRDTKGLYKKARNGDITNFTGISSPYESPLSPDIHIKTANKSIQECAEQVITYLYQHNII